MRHSTRWWYALAALTASIGFVPGTATADDEIPPPYASNVAPVYMIVSFDDTFFVGGEEPSQTIMVNIGSFSGGNGLLATRFLVNQALTTIPIPDGENSPTFSSLQDNSATVLGSFSTTDLGAPHMVTPTAGTIPPDVQLAVFTASNLGDLDALLARDSFPTTTAIAQVIAARLPETSENTFDDVVAAVFNSGSPLSAGDAGASAAGEGEMFPHEPDSPGLFHYKVKFFEDGDFESDLCLRVGMDIHPGSNVNPINLKKKGQLPVAILTTSSFDAQDVDASTAEIGGVLADKSAVEDVDGDGDLDLILHWSVPALVKAGVLGSATTELTVRADLEDGSCIVGTDSVTIVKK